VTTMDVSGMAGSGIIASGGATTAGISIDSSGGSVIGGLNGINVTQAGIDGVIVTAGDVTAGATGIYVHWQHDDGRSSDKRHRYDGNDIRSAG